MSIYKAQREKDLFDKNEHYVSVRYVKLRAVFLEAQAHPWYSKFLSFVWVELRIMAWFGMVDKNDVEKLRAEFGG